MGLPRLSAFALVALAVLAPCASAVTPASSPCSGGVVYDSWPEAGDPYGADHYSWPPRMDKAPSSATVAMAMTLQAGKELTHICVLVTSLWGSSIKASVRSTAGAVLFEREFPVATQVSTEPTWIALDVSPAGWAPPATGEYLVALTTGTDAKATHVQYYPVSAVPGAVARGIAALDPPSQVAGFNESNLFIRAVQSGCQNLASPCDNKLVECGEVIDECGRTASCGSCNGDTRCMVFYGTPTDKFERPWSKCVSPEVACETAPLITAPASIPVVFNVTDPQTWDVERCDAFSGGGRVAVFRFVGDGRRYRIGARGDGHPMIYRGSCDSCLDPPIYYAADTAYSYFVASAGTPYVVGILVGYDPVDLEGFAKASFSIEAV